MTDRTVPIDYIAKICMRNKGIAFVRELFIDNGSDAELTKVAEYSI